MPTPTITTLAAPHRTPALLTWLRDTALTITVVAAAVALAADETTAILTTRRARRVGRS